MVKTPTTDEHLPPEFVEERTQFLHDYGALLTVWGEFELALEVKIAELTGMTPADASIVIGGLSFGAKPSILFSLLDARGQSEVSAKVRAVITHTQRNALVHGIAGSDRDERLFAFFKREIGDRYCVRHLIYKVEEFTAHLEEFCRLYDEASIAMGLNLERLGDYARKAGLLEPTPPRHPARPQREVKPKKLTKQERRALAQRD